MIFQPAGSENRTVLGSLRWPIASRKNSIPVKNAKSFPIFAYTAQYEDVLGRQLSLAASGESTPDKAIKEAATGLEKLMKKSQ